MDHRSIASEPRCRFRLPKRWCASTREGRLSHALAVAWQHDPDFKRWRFSLRPKVTFHDGEALTGCERRAIAASGIETKIRQTCRLRPVGKPSWCNPSMPCQSYCKYSPCRASAVSRKGDAGATIGTGPFRVTAWEPGRRMMLAAFDDYWGGRPYLDACFDRVRTARGHADLFDIPVGPTRRILPEGPATWSSEPRTLVAITRSQRGSGATAGARTVD